MPPQMFRNLTPVVRALLYTNVIVYLLQRLTGLGAVMLWEFALWPPGADPQYGGAPFEPWQILTYAFLHDPRSWMHLFGNMLALYMFGPDIERLLGSRRFGLYYFVCVIGAALTQLLVLHVILPEPYPTLGASGGIFGILLLFGLAFPTRRILVYFAIPVPAWLFVTLYGLAELYFGVFGSMQGVAHFAHLGGMAAGAALILFWRSRIGAARRMG
jgi:membrane associated rhomboid family serine protease